MRLSRSLLRPLRSGGYFFRRRLRSTGSHRGGRAATFFTRKRGSAAAENPEPSSPKVTCIGQVRVKSQKKVKQCRRRINGEASFRSAEPSFQHQQRRSRRDQRWVHLPSVSVVLRALGHEICRLFRCCSCSCRCSCFSRRAREEKRESGCGYGDESACGRWLVAVSGGGDGRRREIEVVNGEGDEEEEEEKLEDSRRHVFDDIEVKGDRIEVNGRSFINGEGGVTISIPPKNALLLMRCRSDPIKMAAIANRISSDAARYEFAAVEVEEEEEEDDDDDDDETTSSDEVLEAQVLEQEKKEMMMHINDCDEEDKLLICNGEEKMEQRFNEEGEEEVEEEEMESNMSSFEALLDTQDCQIKDDDTQVEDQESKKSDKTSANNDDNQQETAAPLPEIQEKEAALPECLLLMMREPKLSMEVSKETWVCATDFIRLLPERPRRAAPKAAAAAGGGGDQEPVVKRRAAVEKSKPRVPPPPSKKNDVQPARSSCSLPAASAAAAGAERKRVSGGACEPLALTRCKSEPMSTAAAKLMPEAGCWKDSVGMKLEPHRQASLEVGAAGVGF